MRERIIGGVYMTDRQILEQILKNQENMQRSIVEMQGSIAEMQGNQENMWGTIAEMQESMVQMQKLQEQMHGKQAEMQTVQNQLQSSQRQTEVTIADLHQSMVEMKLHLENVTNKNICLFAENYGSVVQKLRDAVSYADRQALTELRVNVLEDKYSKMEKVLKKINEKIA